MPSTGLRERLLYLLYLLYFLYFLCLLCLSSLPPQNAKLRNEATKSLIIKDPGPAGPSAAGETRVCATGNPLPLG